MYNDELEAYNRLSTLLYIDELNLDAELIALPQMQQEAAEFATYAKKTMEEAKHGYDVTCADVAANIRNEWQGKPPSVDFVKSETLLYDETRNAMQAYIDAQYNYDRWRALSDSIRSKSIAINTMGELFKAGYLTVESILSKRRAELHATHPYRHSGG